MRNWNEDWGVGMGNGNGERGLGMGTLLLISEWSI